MSLELSGTTPAIKGVAGSVSAPAITGDDADTGISFPSANTIKFSTGGVERMSITDSGVVGAGGGKLLQPVVEAGSNTTVTTSGGSVNDLVSLSITPSSSSSKILIFASFTGEVIANTNAMAWLRVFRGTSSGTVIISKGQGNMSASSVYVAMSASKLDTPNTDSAQTYTMSIARFSGGTTSVSSNGNYYYLQALEIGA